jgi:uncharacterized protein YkwD
VHAKRVEAQIVRPKASASRSFAKKPEITSAQVTDAMPHPYSERVQRQQDVLLHINNLRQMQRLAPFNLSSPLVDLAQEHSERMASFQVPFGHDGFNERVARVSFKTIRAATENVAVTQDLARIGVSVVSYWSMHPAYLSNLLGAFNACGVGVALGRDGSCYVTLLILAL